MARGKVVTQPQKLGRRFYVAMSKTRPEAGRASVIDDDAKEVKLFFRDYAGHEIRHVDGAEMKRLMTI